MRANGHKWNCYVACVLWQVPNKVDKRSGYFTFAFCKAKKRAEVLCKPRVRCGRGQRRTKLEMVASSLPSSELIYK